MTKTCKKLRGEVDLRSLPGYDPNKLLDTLRTVLGVQTDYALAMRMEVPPMMISKIRNLHSPVTASVLLRMHDVSGVAVNMLRIWMNVDPWMIDQHLQGKDEHDTALG